MNAPLAIVNLKATSDPVATIRYFSNPRKVVAAYDGLATGVAVGTPGELADLLMASHHNKRAKRSCRTAVLSVQTPPDATQEQLEDIDQRLLKAAADLRLILGVCSLLGWIHGNTGTRHLHAIFPNSNGRRTLDLRPKFLRQLQAFQWTLALASGRGRGRRKALPCYPKSHKLIMREVAGELLDGDGNIRPDRWNALVAQGKISNFRQRKTGELISFEWGGTGRRVRMATLKGFATECRNTQPANQELYEDCPCGPEPGQAPEPIGELDRLPAPNRNSPALAPTAGPGGRGTLQPPATTEPVALTATALIASQPADGEPTGTAQPGASGASPLPPGGLAGRGRRFQRRPGQQPAPARPDANANPAQRANPRPRFQRPSRPGIGL